MSLLLGRAGRRVVSQVDLLTIEPQNEVGLSVPKVLQSQTTRTAALHLQGRAPKGWHKQETNHFHLSRDTIQAQTEAGSSLTVCPSQARNGEETFLTGTVYLRIRHSLPQNTSQHIYEAIGYSMAPRVHVFPQSEKDGSTRTAGTSVLPFNSRSH